VSTQAPASVSVYGVKLSRMTSGTTAAAPIQGAERLAAADERKQPLSLRLGVQAVAERPEQRRDEVVHQTDPDVERDALAQADAAAAIERDERRGDVLTGDPKSSPARFTGATFARASS